MHDHAVSNHIDAIRIHQATRKQMKVEFHSIHNNRMSRIISALAPAAEIGVLGKNINQLAFA